MKTVTTKKKEAKRRLLRVQVDEISLVAKPAVPSATFLLRKRGDSEDVFLERSGHISFAKAAEHPDHTIVSGPVLIPEIFDNQNDVVSEDVIEQAAHDYLSDFCKVGLQHKIMLPKQKAEVVESYVTRSHVSIGGVTVPRGSWVIAMKVRDPELRTLIRDGKLTGFSIGGLALDTTSEKGDDAESTSLPGMVQMTADIVEKFGRRLSQLEAEVSRMPGRKPTGAAKDPRVAAALSSLADKLDETTKRFDDLDADLRRARGVII